MAWDGYMCGKGAGAVRKSHRYSHSFMARTHSLLCDSADG